MPRSDAVRLFVERAAAAVPGFELNDSNRAAVAEICRKLDGLPLPIELAAARLRAMSPEQILRRLTDRYELLTGGTRSAPTRQQTLRLCIDWSYELCTTPEQLAWERLAIFAGSFELDAAEEICGFDLSPSGVVDVVTSLLDKSILIREESGPVVRFRMLETLRGFGAEKAQESGRYRDLRVRHRDWYRRLAEDANTQWIGDRQLEWFQRIEREQPNLREAMEFCASEDPVIGLTIASALFQFWNSRSLFSEGRYWLDRILDRHSGQRQSNGSRRCMPIACWRKCRGTSRSQPGWWRRHSSSPSRRRTRRSIPSPPMRRGFAHCSVVTCPRRALG